MSEHTASRRHAAPGPEFVTVSRTTIWAIVKGVVSLGTGIFLVANPKVSLGFLVLISCIWLLGYGFIVTVEALRLRSDHARAELRAR